MDNELENGFENEEVEDEEKEEEVVEKTYIDEFVDELKDELLARDFPINDSDDKTLERQVKRAIRQINRCRRFNATEEKPYDAKYEDMIIPLCLTAFSKIGAEGQTSHTENGIVRYYTSGGDYPKDMLAEIIPLIN